MLSTMTLVEVCRSPSSNNLGAMRHRIQRFHRQCLSMLCQQNYCCQALKPIATDYITLSGNFGTSRIRSQLHNTHSID